MKRAICFGLIVSVAFGAHSAFAGVKAAKCQHSPWQTEMLLHDLRMRAAYRLVCAMPEDLIDQALVRRFINACVSSHDKRGNEHLSLTQTLEPLELLEEIRAKNPPTRARCDEMVFDLRYYNQVMAVTVKKVERENAAKEAARRRRAAADDDLIQRPR